MRIIHLWDAAASNSLYGVAEVERDGQRDRIQLSQGDFERMLPQVEGQVAYG
jgi:hypothetical protein